MKILTHLSLSVMLACCMVFPASAQKAASASGPEEKLVDVGGGRLWMQTAGGGGGPVVVLDYGLGGPVNTWQGIFPEVAKFARVVQYHRAGYGKSDAPWAPYTFITAATQMRTMLQRANVPGPYVLVGHSLGNGHLRAFAHLFPNEVAGLVFIDPLNARIFDLATEKEKADEDAFWKENLTRYPVGARSELKWLTGEENKDMKQLRSLSRPPDVPMAVLVAGRHEFGPKWPRAVVEEYGPWVYEASEGSLVLDPESAHYIHRDNPELVISSIKRVVFPSVTGRVSRLIKDKGVDAAITGYREMRRHYPSAFFSESQLNTLGYERLRTKDVKGAIAIFRLNVEMYPEAFNTYDSLGEAYAADGQTSLAVENYRRSLALNAENANAVEMLRKLGVQ